MSTNQKQPATGGPQTQRYSSSPYQPILPQHPTNYTGPEPFHNQGAPYVNQGQGPNQGPGLRSLQPTGPPNQSSTPPNQDLKVAGIPGQIPPQMQYVAGQVRAAPGQFFQSRGTGGPHAQQRMPNQQHRAQGPAQMYPQQYQVIQPLFIQNPPPIYYNSSRQPNNLMPQQSYPAQVYPQTLAYPAFPPPVPAAGPSTYSSLSYQPLAYQATSGTMTMARPTGNPAAAAATNAPAGNLATQAVINQPGPMHNSYSRNTTVKPKRRANALKIIDPNTGQDKSDEIYDNSTNVSDPTSGDSSARQTPQPAPVNHHKEIQAAFAKQVAQAIDEDRQSDSLEPANVLPEPAIEQFHPQPVDTQPLVNARFDIQNSNLQYDAKEFVSIAFIPAVIEPTPIVSANSEAVEVILTKKDRESPVKSRKQAPREPKPDPPKEIQPKDISDCDKSSSIVKEEIVSVPQITVANTQPAVAEPIPPEAKEPAIEVAAEKKPSKKPAPVEPKSSEPEVQPTLAAAETVPSGNGKSKNFRNKHVQNGKSHPAPAQQAAPVQVPVPQPPKSNNRSSKTKDINLKGANKEGTDMDAFNDNKPKTEVNANVVLQNDTEKVAVASNTFTKSVDPIIDLVNANPIQQTGPPPKVVPKPVETDTGSFPQIPAGKDANENDTTIKAETITVNNTPLSSTAAVTATVAAPATATASAPAAAPVSTKAVNKRFDVTSIIKDDPKPAIIFPIVDNRDDQADQGAISKTTSLRNDVKAFFAKIIYKPGQWAPNRTDGKKVYDRDFLWSLKNLPASNLKPDKLPDYILSDTGNHQMDSRLSMAGRSDHMPSFNNYVGKSGSQRGAVSKRGSQSGKMGSRGGDKPSGKPQPKVSISLRGDVKLHESENAWKPTRLNKGDCEDEEQKKTDALLKKFRSVLNKLTPQRFSTLVEQVSALQIDTKERLEGVINLMFDKAIDEPNFANSYAMMCKEIQNMQVNVSDKSLVFRGLLVNRCQQEFEKQSIDETVRNMKVKEIEESTDPEKKKELEIELEEYDRRLRMKSVGTIRFIGELFKQQMLTVKIVRRCLESLLVNKDEESLECLCKLLSTIGKELEKTCTLHDIFEEMKRITEGKRQAISSRIRFMLQDAIDLRESKWVPRRGDTVPKTIDQIQKEAETEQMNQAMNNSNPPPRKDDRGGNMRGSGNNNRSKQSSEEGWSSVPQKNNRPFSIQSSKMRAPKLTADERLGSSQMFGAFVKGAGSSKNTQSVLNHGSNMYNALQNADMQDGRSLQPRGKDPYSSKGPSMERNTYKGVYEGRGSRSGSQHRDSNIPMWGMAPPQPAPASMPPPVSQVVVQPPPPAAPAPVAQISEEQLERKVRVALDEFITVCCTSEEFFQDISPHVLPKDLHKVVYQCYNYVLEKSQTSRLKTGELFATLISAGKLSVEDFIKGFVELLGLWEDLVIDMPQIWQYFAEDIVSLILGEAMTIQALRSLLEDLVQNNVAKNLLKPLFALVIKEKGPNFLQTIFLQSGLQLSDFMPASDVEPFVQQNNLEFLIGGGAPVGQSLLSGDALKKKLSEFFQRKAPFDDIVNWISANVGDRVKDFEFTRALAGAIFEDSIPKNKLQPEVLTSHSKLLQKYVDNDTAYELQCLYVLQSLVHKLEHPSGLLLSICDKLYEDSTFCQESFIAWEKSTDPAEQEGKGVALKQLTSFFTRLKENEEDDDSSSHSEDA